MYKNDNRNNILLLDKILKSSNNFPRILWWQANEILYKIQKQQRNDSIKHPCVTTWLKLVRCMRRYPHSMVRQCNGEASRHYQCTLVNKDWIYRDDVNYIKILECFHLFKKRNKNININSQEYIGYGTSTTFSGG